MGKLENMTVDELDQETIRLKEEQPAKMREKLLAVRAARDPKVNYERQRDRLKKILINAMGRPAEDADAYLKGKSLEEIETLIKPFEDIESQMGVVATVETGVVELKGQ